MPSQNPSASDLIVAITLLADSKNAVQNVKILEAELEKLGVSVKLANSQLRKITDSGAAQRTAQGVKELNSNLQNVPQHANRATKGFWSFSNMARTALGTLEAMAIFLVTRFIGQAISKSIDGIKQLELAVYNLAVAEKSLSRQGIDIAPQDFKDIIIAVQDLNLAISEIDITKSIADLATGLRDLGLSKDQLEGLAKAAAVIANAKGLPMENVVAQFVQGIAKGGRGLADLDIQVDAAVIKQKALEAQLVESEDAWNNLTAEQKQSIETQALYLIILDSANTRLEELGILQDSVTIKQKKASAAWEDLTALLGATFAPALKAGFDILLIFLEDLRNKVVAFRETYIATYSLIVGLFAATKGLIKGNIQSLAEFRALVEQAALEASQKLSKFMVPALPEEDTPTGTPSSGGDIEEEQSDLQKALEKMNDEILESQIKLAQDMEEAAIDLGRKLEDITIEYERKRADAYRDHANRVADINASHRSRVAEIQANIAEENQKARNDELEREAKFQEEMRQLKERFLMDLEDALHARDAREVLRLIKQYNLAKAQAEREHALDQENAERDLQERQAKHRADLARAEAERKEKLAAAQRDLQDKLAKLAADEQAERDAAELAYRRKIEDLEREMQDRLEIVAANLIAEFNLTKEGLDAILALYQKYYQEISQIYAAMNAMLAGQGALAPNKSQNTLTNKKSSGGGGSGKKYAEGGSMIANRPTTVTFGENNGEFELATFIPLGHRGRDVNKVFSNVGGMSGMGSGEIGIDLMLSPDLEARIVKNTLGETAKVITTIHRSKR